MIPGINVLSMALTVIAPQTVLYYAFQGRVTNAAGLDVATYATPVEDSQGSVQPVERKLYQQFGLDLRKSYVNWFVSRAILDVARDVSGDQFVYAGSRYQCQSITNWKSQDGWVQVLAVEIPE